MQQPQQQEEEEVQEKQHADNLCQDLKWTDAAAVLDFNCVCLTRQRATRGFEIRDRNQSSVGGC